jgi:Domain of unknown function (DUF4135)
VDYQKLNQRLQRLRVTPKDDLRASLYIDYLEDFDLYFTKLYAFGHHNYAFVKKAVTSADLLNELAEVLDSFVAPAVGADLKRAHQTAPGWTYRDYFDHIILDGDTRKHQANLKAFRTRYSITDHALTRLCNNFKSNIIEMCERVMADRQLLVAFYADLYNNSLDITSLNNIRSTGSDFHKGGKQVLILTFEITYKESQEYKRGKLKVVYKPSDLEIDCLIAGDSAAINRVQTGFMEKSLFEIYNTGVEKYGKQLARLGEGLDTYRILPRNFISSQAPDQYPLPIREAYGYIQYLNHKVFLSNKRMIFDLEYLEVGGKSDYLIFPDDKTKSAIISRFYRKSGAFAALACSFSILDMHCENIRVMQYSPYAIDLEISLTGEVNNVTDTDLLASDAGGMNAVSSEENSDWDIKKVFNKASRQQEWTVKRGRQVKYHQNRLWNIKRAGFKTPIPLDDSALLEGFETGMTILSACQTNNDFDSWFKRIQNVVVRFLMAGTGELTELRDKCFVENVSEGKELGMTLEKLLRVQYESGSSRYMKPPHPSQPSPFERKANPYFVFLAWPQTKEDYENLDIPAFYHRIGTLDIVDSRGKQLPLPASIKIGRSTIFANTPTLLNVKRLQVNALANERFDERLQALKQTILAQRKTASELESDIKNIFRPIKD